MTLLAIESSTKVCSVVLADETRIIASREVVNGNQHAALLTKFMEEVLQEGAVSGKEIDAVAVSKGPGSYTGLRIGASAAKGICFACNIPLVAVSSLFAMARKAGYLCSPGDIVVPMIDARRMEVYREVYDHQMNLLESVEPVIINPESFDHYTRSGRVFIVGDGILKFGDTFAGRENILLIPEIYPQAEYLVQPAIERLQKGDADDLAYFEPLYVKDFAAGKPRVKGLL
ncbi:MAG TPA: tRNA (adenosine(37)-N6)-threonylcarbamoyltransferase complex dimerization subunit type 1 TsaB [Bacteroidales bacterium]|nr:tRNA (adenosine(37)-N6)-threonylcarbamoyltransferase complex dimerization subunit type 1 TsaB [Bacteroidales bacterium]HRZ48879.1 tRNA (adenosine(37)-N6)-threonylcarbamoyltransferase complex dimerization subunit type 1 TsaB [Bacteroidales bacterium]